MMKENGSPVFFDRSVFSGERGPTCSTKTDDVVRVSGSSSTTASRIWMKPPEVATDMAGRGHRAPSVVTWGRNKKNEL